METHPPVPARRAGVTLVEVLIATIIMAIAGVAAMNIFTASSFGIRQTDERRELRYYIREIFAHVNRQPLHELWDHYGPQGFELAPRPLVGALALVDASGKLVDPAKPQFNPLGFTQGFLDDLRRDGLSAKIWFEFYYRDQELRYKGKEPDPQIGLRHMQAGVAAVSLYDVNDPEERSLLLWRQPVMCAAIVGRPGLQLSSCPAMQKDVKCRYGPVLARREGRTWTPEDQSDCN